ncbi:hypothetical protein J2X35_002831 [Mesorhizobium sp. BE184]|nr:hypothetical protein [Mesorhizobium sp. BE184]
MPFERLVVVVFCRPFAVPAGAQQVAPPSTGV